MGQGWSKLIARNITCDGGYSCPSHGILLEKYDGLPDESQEFAFHRERCQVGRA